MFGIQYKALYSNAEDHWPLDKAQHSKLHIFSDWAFYGLSEMKKGAEHNNALQRTVFVRVKIKYKKRLNRSDLKGFQYRWCDFVNGLEDCTIGKRVRNKRDIQEALRPTDRSCIAEVDKDLVDVFVANLSKKRLLHLNCRH